MKTPQEKLFKALRRLSSVLKEINTKQEAGFGTITIYDDGSGHYIKDKTALPVTGEEPSRFNFDNLDEGTDLLLGLL